ncbi:response regulator transcription factor [Streptomyces sulfonofaciens]|uniref:response regulator transcription factor n=1 Tax=Streptomyces sulfonofaciens TaxID=68272 RepID=UPI001E3854A0|nr:response regulator transcription factor [Streptomyces sulfonofaciens]
MIQVMVMHRVDIMRDALVALLRMEQMLAEPLLTGSGRRAPACPPGASPQGEVALPLVCVADDDCLEDLSALPAPPGEAPCTKAEAARPGQDSPVLLVLTGPRRPGRLRRAIDVGALGYVDKYGAPGRLVEGIRTVASGERFVDESLAFDFLQAGQTLLTPRELNVLSLAAEGAPVGDIADALHLACGTVRNYLASAIRKVGGRNRLDAIRISRRAGWI